MQSVVEPLFNYIKYFQNGCQISNLANFDLWSEFVQGKR